MLKSTATALLLVVLGVAATVVTGVNMGGLTRVVANAAAAKYSRDHEREADYVGTYIAALLDTTPMTLLTFGGAFLLRYQKA